MDSFGDTLKRHHEYIFTKIIKIKIYFQFELRVYLNLTRIKPHPTKNVNAGAAYFLWDGVINV